MPGPALAASPSKAEPQRPEFMAVTAVESRKPFVILEPQGLDRDHSALENDHEHVPGDDRYPMAGRSK